MASTMIHIRQAKCWLMVADIIGSTKLSQTLSASQFPRMTGTWFKNCRQIVDECGGHMSKYLGDGFFCYWNRIIRCTADRAGANQIMALPIGQAQPGLEQVGTHGQN